jgi:hypothetical protein
MDSGEVQRDERGRLLPGSKINPTGENGHLKGYQPYGQRSLKWLEELSTDELLDLYQDKIKFGKLSVYDSMIITNLVDTLVAKERGAERERLLSRIEGQPKSTTDLNVNGKLGLEHGLDNNAREFIASRIAGIASRVGPTEDNKRDDGAAAPEPPL